MTELATAPSENNDNIAQDDHLQLPLYSSLTALGSDVKPSSTGHNIEEHKGLNLPVERS